MKRSDFLIRLVSFVVFLAIAVYIGYAIIDAQLHPLSTVLAVRYTMEDAEETSGYIVREETPLAGARAVVTATEGEHLSAADPYAMEYLTSAALERAEKIRELDLRIARIDARLSGESSAAAAEAVMALSRAVSAGGAGGLDAALFGVRSQVFSEGGSASAEELAARRAELQQQRAQLQAAAGADTNALLAGRSGTFSAVTDGLEHIAPDALDGLQPADLPALFSGVRPVNAVGKLITGLSWYYVCVMPSAAANRLAAGRTAQLHFTQSFGRTIAMRVESVGISENGQCVVVFSSNRFLAEVAAVRETTASVVFASHDGLRIPREAVRVDEKGKYVFILTGLQAHQVYVDVLYELGDYYLVESVTPGELAEGVSVIVKANDLYDGKVVQA